MLDIHVSLEIIQQDMIDAMPYYLYVQFYDIMLSVVWIAIILALFALIRRGRARFREQDAKTSSFYCMSHHSQIVPGK